MKSFYFPNFQIYTFYILLDNFATVWPAISYTKPQIYNIDFRQHGRYLQSCISSTRVILNQPGTTQWCLSGARCQSWSPHNVPRERVCREHDFKVSNWKSYSLFSNGFWRGAAMWPNSKINPFARTDMLDLCSVYDTLTLSIKKQ